jgi:metallophosphoesterase (TIGR00282 family)
MACVLLVGDVVGDSGLDALRELLPGIKNDYSAQVTIVNGENAAGGFGMTEAAAVRIFAAGADIITSGNHIWEKRDFLPFMDSDPRILRPANYPPGLPGRGVAEIEKDGARYVIINLQGRENMGAIDCPFRTFDAIYAEKCGISGAESGGPPPPVIIVDFHAESTREKEALAFYLDGRAACVAGTHTHVQTADERLLPAGTAYITDLGYSGAADSIIGMDKTICLDRARTQIQFKMESAKGKGLVQGIALQIDNASSKATSIERWTRRQLAISD